MSTRKYDRYSVLVLFILLMVSLGGGMYYRHMYQKTYRDAVVLTHAIMFLYGAYEHNCTRRPAPHNSMTM